MHLLTSDCFTYNLSTTIYVCTSLCMCVHHIASYKRVAPSGSQRALCKQCTAACCNWTFLISTDISCPANSNYSSCMSACPASCSDFTSPSECESPCVEGCECLPGYVLSGFDCVPYRQCGCTYLGKYYEVRALCGSDSSRSTKQCFFC